MKRFLIAIACILGATATTAAPKVIRVSGSGTGASWRIDFDDPVIDDNGVMSDVAIDGCEPLLVAGHPALPSFGFSFDIPANATIESIKVCSECEPKTISLPHPLRHVARQIPLSDETKGTASEPNEEIYSLNAPWPPLDPVRFRTDKASDHACVGVTLFPIQYIPQAKTILCHESIILSATWRIAESQRTNRIRIPARRSSPVSREAVPYSMPDGIVDYAIISTTALLDTPGPYNFQALCEAREAQGYSTALISKTWIYDNYEGADNIERIRNFVIDAHRNHGLKYLVMAASSKGPFLLPMRTLHSDFQSGSATYSEEIASDVYLSCLDGDFDSNGNGIYGEIGDGENGGDIDLLAEVMVGRVPVSTSDDVANFVAKILRYESAASNEVASAAFVGEKLGFGGVSEYAWNMLEQIRLGGEYDSYSTIGFADSAYASRIDHSRTLYDAEDSPEWKASDIIGLFNNGPRFINHLGHGKLYYGDKDKKIIVNECMKIGMTTNDTATLGMITNDVGFVLYSQACSTAAVDRYPDTWTEQMIAAPHACVAAIANTRSGFGAENSTDGGSQRLHRHFIDELLSDRATTIGEAFVRSKESLISQIPPDKGNVLRWCYYSNNLFGDPAMPFAPQLRLLPPTIEHECPETQTSSTEPYRINATFGPAGFLDMASPSIIWYTDNGAPQTNVLTRLSRCDYGFQMPAQPFGTRIHYRLEAMTVAGVGASCPADSSWHTFVVTSPHAIDGTIIMIK